LSCLSVVSSLAACTKPRRRRKSVTFDSTALHWAVLHWNHTFPWALLLHHSRSTSFLRPPCVLLREHAALLMRRPGISVQNALFDEKLRLERSTARRARLRNVVSLKTHSLQMYLAFCSTFVCSSAVRHGRTARESLLTSAFARALVILTTTSNPSTPSCLFRIPSLAFCPTAMPAMPTAERPTTLALLSLRCRAFSVRNTLRLNRPCGG
jgi:hypothetical protein